MGSGALLLCRAPGGTFTKAPLTKGLDPSLMYSGGGACLNYSKDQPLVSALAGSDFSG